MYHLLFIKVLTIIVMAVFSGLKPQNPFAIKDFGRIGFGRPAPPAQLFFPSSADWADDFRLHSLANVTFAVPPSLLHLPDSVGSSPPVDNLSSSFLPAPSSTRVLLGFFHGVAKIASRVRATMLVVALQILSATSWVLATALVAALQVLTTIAWILATVLVTALQVLVSSQSSAMAAHALRDQRNRDRLELELGTVELLASFWNVAAWADYQHEILTVLRAQLKRSEEDRGSMDALLRRHDEDRVQERNSVLAEKAAEYDEKLLATRMAAFERYDKAQLAATERIRSLEAQQREAQEAAARLDADLKAARQHITGLMSTISNQAQRLQAAGPASFQHRPPPPSFPPSLPPAFPPSLPSLPSSSFSPSLPSPFPPSFPSAPPQPQPIQSFESMRTGNQPPFHPGRGRGGAGRGGRGGRGGR